MSQAMLYRAAATANPDVWGLKVEHAVFNDEDVPTALEAGWFAHPRDVPQPEPVAAGKGAAKAE